MKTSVMQMFGEQVNSHLAPLVSRGERKACIDYRAGTFDIERNFRMGWQEAAVLLTEHPPLTKKPNKKTVSLNIIGMKSEKCLIMLHNQSGILSATSHLPARYHL